MSKLIEGSLVYVNVGGKYKLATYNGLAPDGIAEVTLVDPIYIDGYPITIAHYDDIKELIPYTELSKALYL